MITKILYLKQKQVNKEHRSRQENGIDQIQHAADTGHHMAAVFCFQTPLKDGFNQISKNRDQSKKHSEHSGVNGTDQRDLIGKQKVTTKGTQ